MNGTKARRMAAVERYIHELAISLADVPADEREEVIAGVRDHIEDALTAIPDPGDENVQQVLTKLGDPAEIAADARGRTSAPTPPPASTTTGSTAMAYQASRAHFLSEKWVPVAVASSFALAGFTALLSNYGLHPGATVLWLAGLFVLVASPLWSSVEKLVGVIWFGVAPVIGVYGEAIANGSPMRVSIDGGVLRDVVYRSYDVFGGQPIYMSALLAGTIGTVVIMAWLIIAGSKRARALNVTT